MSNAPIVYRRLRELGYSPAQAAGVIGNLQQESGSRLDPNVVGDKGTAFGIAQWRGPRFEELQRFASQANKDWRDPVLQTDFIDYELKNSERRAGDLLRSAKTPEEAVRAFVAFERPAGFRWGAPEGAHGFDNRLKFALSFNPDGTATAAAPAPVYKQDMATAARWLGNKILPDQIDAPTPMTAEEVKTQNADLAQSAGYAKAAGGLLNLAKLMQEKPEPEEEMMPAQMPERRRVAFRPLPTMRGLL
jgi:hypothetical protein